MSLRFQVEPLPLMLEEMQVLSKAHGEEVAHLHHDDVIINPSWGSMLALDAAGLMLCVAGRTSEGALCAYATFVLFPDLHRTLKDGTPLLAAQDDAYYVAPEVRGPRVALRMFMEVEAEMRVRGVRKLSVHTKDHLPQERLFGALGFVRDDVIMVKYLEPLVTNEAPSDGEP